MNKQVPKKHEKHLSWYKQFRKQISFAKKRTMDFKGQPQKKQS